MKNQIVFFFSCLIFNSLSNAQTVVKGDSIKYYIPFLSINDNTELDELKIYPVDTFSIRLVSNIPGKTGKGCSLRYLVRGIPMTFDWYDVQGEVFVSINDYSKFLAVAKLSNAGPDKRSLISELQKHNTGIKKVSFQNGFYGIYTDKWYHRKNVKFDFSFEVIERIYNLPVISRLDKYVKISEYSPIFESKVMLVFQSEPSGGPAELAVKRQIYFDLNDYKMKSIEIRSMLQYPIYH